METLRRTIHPETKVLDAKSGIVEYVASDETLDCHREVVKASGWKFTNFRKNAPFVDSHEYGSLDKLLGSVKSFKVDKGKLVETVQWAIDVPDNKLAQLGYKMTEAGYLKAVSVGFYPTKAVNRYSTGKDFDTFKDCVEGLGMSLENGPERIFLEQEQIELSAVVIGANPNALSRIAKAYKAEVLCDEDIETLSRIQFSHEETVKAATFAQVSVAAEVARKRARFLRAFEQTLTTMKL